MNPAQESLSVLRLDARGLEPKEVAVIREAPLTIEIDGKEMVTLLCTPTRLNCLVLGFLYLEGIIESLDEVALMEVCAEETIAKVKLNRPWEPERVRRVLTSGCGGGTTFLSELDLAPIEGEVRVGVEDIFHGMRLLLDGASVYRETGGVHTSALYHEGLILAMAEDVGRHNTIDKIAGECLLRGISPQGKTLLTTGRISSEMLLKAAKMRVPILVSRSSPTHLAVRLAEQLRVTLIGYLRGQSMNIYAGRERLKETKEATLRA